jgi:catalase
MSNQPPNTTTNAGIPVPSDECSLTAGPAGPVLLQDAYLIEKLAHFVRERVPRSRIPRQGRRRQQYGYVEYKEPSPNRFS